MTTAERERKKAKKRMGEIVKRYQHYVATYTDTMCYDENSDKTYLDDMLYGIGISFGVAAGFDFADGYDRFKQKLQEHLTTTTGGIQSGSVRTVDTAIRRSADPDVPGRGLCRGK